MNLAKITTDQWENIYKKIINAVDLNKLLLTEDPITHHYIVMVNILLKSNKVDATAKNNEAIRYASKKGHLEVVKLLS